VYRAHIYVQNDILGYRPGGGDLAYPEKLEMMKVSCSYKPIYNWDMYVDQVISNLLSF